MSISKTLSGNVDAKVKRWAESAKRQGQDLDKMSEQELKYLIELNKPQPHKVISADSPEGRGITEALFGKRGKVIKADFGKPFAEEVVTVERVITDIKKLDPIEAMKETNKVLKGEGRYKSLSKADREKIAVDESVTDHIFERNIEEPEDFAQGGRTGLSYLLAEDTNERIGFGLGGFNAARRAFLKAMGAGAATVGAAKSGLFGLLKGGGKKQIAKELTQVPIKNIDGMPAWFKPLVNKVIKEGKAEKITEYDRLITHTTKLPDSKTPISVSQDLNNGDVWVDIGRDKHGFADGHLGQPVRLEYKASELIEPPIVKEGKVVAHGKGSKTKEEFWVEEAEFTGGHPENVKFEESTIEKFGDHGSNFDEVEMFATGKVKKSKPTKKAQQLEWEQGKAEADADAAADMADDFASGGIAKMLGE